MFQGSWWVGRKKSLHGIYCLCMYPTEHVVRALVGGECAIHIHVLDFSIAAERLSARLLILQCVFLVGGVWCHASGMQFVTLRNAIKGVACVQTSVLFRNAIKRSCLQKFVYTYVSLSSPAL